MTEPAVLVNLTAAGGRGTKNWQRIAKLPRFRSWTHHAFMIDKFTRHEEVSCWVQRELIRGCDRFVSVGGDGTLNSLLNLVMTHVDDSKKLTQLKLGAIGTGSSNDFHKPIQAENRISGFPCRLNFKQAAPADILYVKDLVGSVTRYFLINASIGMTAKANYFFNHPSKILKGLKLVSSNLSILYAAFKTMAVYKNSDVRISLDGGSKARCLLTNLGLVKNRHFSGSFRYDIGAENDSGDFVLHLCQDMSLKESLRTLWNLSAGRFSGLPKTTTLYSKSVQISGEEKFCLEMDGEVIETQSVEVGVFQERILLCK